MPQKTKAGEVIRKSSDKTIIVKVERLVRNKHYEKYLRKTRKFFVHDEKNEANVGDKVKIAESRPISKLKRWKLASILERAA